MKPRPRRSLSLLAALIGASLAAPASAGDPSNIITVTTISDAMDASDGQCSLREALVNANTNTQFSPVVNECPAGSGTATDEILLQAATSYTLTVSGGDDESGDLDVHDDPSLAAELHDVRIGITGGDSNATIEQQVAGERVLHNDGASIVISGVILRGGATAEVGGGIYNQGGSLDLQAVGLIDNTAVSGGGLYSDGDANVYDVSVSDNSADLIGGGIFHENGALSIEDTFLGGNNASSGAGIYADGGTTLLESVTLFGNAATSNGGAITSTGTNALTLTDVEVLGNTAQDAGGGIFSDSTTEIELLHSEFSGNQAGNFGGAVHSIEATIDIEGGLYSDNSAVNSGGALRGRHIQATSARFENNTTDGWGGAMYCTLSCNLDDSVASGNTAHDGGAIVSQILNMERSRIVDNSATRYGGGAYVNNDVDIFESMLVGNNAGDAGGGIWYTPSNFNGVISRSLFEDNTATNDGGGVWLGADENALLMANNTFSGNSATTGAGSGLYVDTGASAFAYNTTFAGNGPTESIAKYGELTLESSIITSSGIDCVVALEDPQIISLGHNLSDDDTCIGLDQTGDQTEVDALLAPLANNGGNTRTHALLPGSPAIDAAADASCFGKLTQGVDQRGAPRPNIGCDIGAHEQEVELPEIFADGFED